MDHEHPILRLTPAQHAALVDAAKRRAVQLRAEAMQYLDVQRSHLMEWKTAVATAIARGWSRDETVARVDFRDRFGPVDIGQGYMLDYIQSRNAAALYDKLTGGTPQLTGPDGTPAQPIGAR
mgnify:CR=1 FL=1